MGKQVRRRRTVVATGVMALGLLLVSWHYWTIYHSLTTAKSALLGVEASLNDSGLDVTASDLATARSKVASADANLRQARVHLRWDPVVAVMGHSPVLGRQVQAANDLLAMAQLVVQIGREGIAAGENAIAIRDRPSDGQPLTRSLVELIGESDAQLTSVESLTALLVERRIALGDRALLPPLDSLRTSMTPFAHRSTRSCLRSRTGSSRRMVCALFFPRCWDSTVSAATSCSP